jgi:glycosyltransferase involved in cell wall biosynthesis
VAGHEVTVLSIRTLDCIDALDGTILAAVRWRAKRLDFRSKRKRIFPSLIQRSALALQRLVGVGYGAETAASPFALALSAAAFRVKADLYIAHYVAALPAAARAAAHHCAAYAFDAEDFHMGDLPDAPEHALTRRIIQAIESRYLPGTAYMTAASPLIAKAYAETYGVPLPTVILNVFPKSNAPAMPTPRGSAQPGPSVYWFSQTIGPGRGLEIAVQAIARAQSRPHLYLRGIPAVGYDTYLRNLAAGVGAADKLHFLDPVPPDELEGLGAAYDLGYVGELAETSNRLIALTNKLFSYLLGGVPSLATDIPAHRQLAPQLGEAMTLFPIGDVAALAGAIDRFLIYPQCLATARTHAWRLGQTRFNWDLEQTTFLRTTIAGVADADV